MNENYLNKIEPTRLQWTFKNAMRQTFDFNKEVYSALKNAFLKYKNSENRKVRNTEFKKSSAFFIYKKELARIVFRKNLLKIRFTVYSDYNPENIDLNKIQPDDYVYYEIKLGTKKSIKQSLKEIEKIAEINSFIVNKRYKVKNYVNDFPCMQNVILVRDGNLNNTCFEDEICDENYAFTAEEETAISDTTFIKFKPKNIAKTDNIKIETTTITKTDFEVQQEVEENFVIKLSNVVSCERLDKDGEIVPLLNRISFVVCQNDFVGICSSDLKVANVLRDIIFCNKPYFKGNINMSDNFGVINTRCLQCELTVIEQLAFSTSNLKPEFSPEEKIKFLFDVLTALKINNLCNKPIKELTEAEKLVVSTLIFGLSTLEILFVDVLDFNLNDGESKVLKNTLDFLKQLSKTIVVFCKKNLDAESLCEKSLYIEDGKVTCLKNNKSYKMC